MSKFRVIAALALIAVPQARAQDKLEVSGVILPRDGGGMFLRNAEGDRIEIEWSEKTQVALKVDTRQLGDLKLAVAPARPRVGLDPVKEARKSLSSLERDVMDKPEEIFAQAGAAIANFLGAATYKERLKFARNPKRVEALMAKFYQGNADGPIEFRKPRDGWKLQPYRRFLLTTVEMADFREVAVAVERSPDGEYLVDWESFVAYSEIPWDQIEKQRSTKPFLVRARAAIGDYYNHGYKDDEWACVRLEDAQQEHTFYGYVKLDDPLLSELKNVMTFRGSTHVTLKVAYPEGGKGKQQLLITDVVAKGWVSWDRSEPVGEAGVLKFRVHSSSQTIDFKLPAGPITGIVKVPTGQAVQAALQDARDEQRIEERGLVLRFNEKPAREQLPSAADPRFVGLWDPTTKPRRLRIGGVNYELSLKLGEQSNALLFNVLTTADCKPLVNRATVIGRKRGAVIVADEIHLQPIGAQVKLDE